MSASERAPGVLATAAVPALIAIALGTVLTIALGVVSAQARADAEEHARARVESQLASHSQALTATLERGLATIVGLSRYATLTLPEGPTEMEFRAFASGLATSTEGVRALQLAPHGIVTLVEPVEGNVFGNDLLHDERPEVREDIARTLESTGTVISGPYELRQGGLGVVARRAIRDADGEFWGFATVVMDVPPLLAAAGLDTAPPGLRFAISDDRGRVFAGDPAVFDESPSVAEVVLPDGVWTVAAVPSEGWAAAGRQGQLTLWGLGLVAIAAASLVAFLGLSYQRSLRAQVIEQTDLVRRQSALFARVTEVSPVGVLVVAMDGAIVSANPAAEAILGVSSEELCSRRFDDPRWGVTGPDGRPLTIGEMPAARVRESGMPVFDLRHEVDTPHGRTVVSVNAAPLHDEDGQLDGVVVTFADVTERSRDEDALRHSEHLFHSTMDTMLEACQILGFDWTYLYLNHAAEIQNRRPNSELLGRRFADMWPDIEATDVYAGIKRSLEERVSQTMHVEFTFPDGSVGWYEVRVQPVPEGVLILSADVTKRHLQAAELQRAHARVQRLVDANIVGVAIARADGAVLEANDYYLDLIGYSRAEFDDGLVSWRDLTPPEWLPADERAIEELLARGACAPYEKEYVRRDGSRVSVLISDAVVPESDGEIVAFVLDVTERKEQERELDEYRDHLEQLVAARTEELTASNVELDAINEELRSMVERLDETNERLQEATSAKSRFLANMSHELRTPLNSIIGFSGLLLGGLVGELTAEQQKQIEMISRSGQHLLSLINDILDLSKVEAGAVVLHVESTDVAEIVREVAATARPLAEEKGLSLDAHVGPCEHLQTDPSRVRQILLNLVGNAVKYTERGRIDVGLECVDDEVRIWVEDTGPGIPPDEADRIFHAFAQVERADHDLPKGTGLGLTISREFAQMLGGRIRVSSEVGKGSTFMLVLPRCGAPLSGPITC